jgi:hypothetical protein
MKRRIKIEELNSGKKQYTPQVYNSITNSWHNIYLDRTINFISMDNSVTQRFDTEQEAIELFEKLNYQIESHRLNEVKTYTYTYL